MTIKKLLTFLLACVLVFSITACGGGDDPSTSEDKNKNDKTVLQEEPKETVPEKPSRPYPNNILMDLSEGDQDDPAFGSKNLTRRDVTSVTFLDTLADMPGDAWDVSENQDGSVMAWEKGTALYVAGDGGVTASTCNKLFYRFYELKEINFNDCFYTDISKDMRAMFCDCWDLESLDVSFFYTSNATDMRTMFEGCSTLKTLDLSSFDTSSVTQMDHMFFMCDELVELNISSFDTAKVRGFGGTFSCSELEALDVSHFDTSSATDMSGMFYGCYSLKELDVSNFDTANVTDMTQMFMNCKALTSLDLSNFDTSKVTRLGSMFAYVNKLETVDVSSFNTANCTKFGQMFLECTSLKTLDLSGFDFSQAEDARSMFKACGLLTDIGCTITLPEGCNSEDMYLGSGLN
ncbi:MAG: BspA family leucine-rich repeat surface protein [Oscillospiraceae bacterium]|nr:BspA family leucine-rich repeat surface protein [Oscillospiraceae bacterium]